MPSSPCGCASWPQLPIAFPPGGFCSPSSSLPPPPQRGGPHRTSTGRVPSTVRRRGRTLSIEDLERMRERTLPDGTRVPGGLPAWLWSFAPNETIAPRTLEEIPTDTAGGPRCSPSLSKRLVGSSWGPVTAYALDVRGGHGGCACSIRTGADAQASSTSRAPTPVARLAVARPRESTEKPRAVSFDTARGLTISVPLRARQVLADGRRGKSGTAAAEPAGSTQGLRLAGEVRNR